MRNDAAQACTVGVARPCKDGLIVVLCFIIVTNVTMHFIINPSILSSFAGIEIPDLSTFTQIWRYLSSKRNKSALFLSQSV